LSLSQYDTSPDGTRIVVGCQTPDSVDLYVYSYASDHLTRITNTPDVDEQRARWSPDGTRIVYRGAVDSASSISTINPDGSDVRIVIPAQPWGNDTPAWQPCVAAALRGGPPPAPPSPIELSLTGGGTGTVTSSPAGLSCSGAAGTVCSVGFVQDSTVTLTATPAAGSVFAGWLVDG